MEQKNLPSGTYGYSAVRMENLGATEYTLVTIVQDVSGSVSGYKSEMEKCLKEIVRSCVSSPRADNLMIRLVQFHSTMDETHGFKLLTFCNPDDYNGILNIGGNTALYDAVENSIAATASYGKELAENDFLANAIVFIITDGCDNESAMTTDDVKNVLQDTVMAETLESFITILIGVGTGVAPGVSQMLDDFRKKSGLTQYVELANADAKTLAKLALFVSRSISSQSQSLGTGGKSQQMLVI
jgi:uncharacterized protein YegL